MRLLDCICRVFIAILVTAPLIITLPSATVADDYSSPDSSSALAVYSEGPHVLWRDSSCVTVFYLCGDEIVSQDFESDDTVRFSGLCADSLREYKIPTETWQVEPAEYSGISRVFAVSDLHGEYEVFESLLINAGIVDSALNWSFGEGHLVVNGDVFDRGDRVTECLWLIYRLEQEAGESGGRVHFLLGNHEKMVLRGDLRYVHDSYKDGIVKKTRISYDDLFGPDMELGRWLRSKNTVIRIDSVLYVHAGIIPWIVDEGFTIDQINTAVRRALDLRSYDLAFGAEPGRFSAARGRSGTAVG